MIHFTQYTNMYLNLCVRTTGNYNIEDIEQLSDIQTCVSKDIRPGFEGHDVVEISWTPHLDHGMYITTYVNFINYAQY